VIFGDVTSGHVTNVTYCHFRSRHFR
jgi:hypothetical protein